MLAGHAIGTPGRTGCNADVFKSEIEDAVRVERTLNAEIRRRVESNKALQSMFEAQLTAVQDKLKQVFSTRYGWTWLGGRLA